MLSSTENLHVSLFQKVVTSTPQTEVLPHKLLWINVTWFQGVCAFLSTPEWIPFTTRHLLHRLSSKNFNQIFKFKLKKRKLLSWFILLQGQPTTVVESFQTPSETIPSQIVCYNEKTGIVIALLWRSSWKFNINAFSLPSLYSSRAPVKNCFVAPAMQLNINPNLLWILLNPLLLPLCTPLSPRGLILLF